MGKLSRKIGAGIVRVNALLLMGRVAHTGGDAAAAHSQQSRAEFRFFRGGGFLCPHAAAERGSSVGGAIPYHTAVIGGRALRALS